MVSPELLRRYPLFGSLGPEHLNAIAMLSEEIRLEGGATLFEAAQSADDLYVMIDGCLDLYYVAADELNPTLRRELFVSELNPGDPLGISALLEPYVYQGTVRASCPSRLIKVEAAGLRALCEVDSRISAVLMRAVAQAALDRLDATRVQLAAARA